MSKRDILLIVSLSLTLFLVNLFFSYREQEKNREWLVQQSIAKAKRQKEGIANISFRTAKPQTLPLVGLYADATATSYVTTGVRNGTSILALSWTSPLPQSLYARDVSSANQPREVRLVRSGDAPHAPVVYAEGSPSPLRIGELNTLGNADLILTSVQESTSPETVRIALGEYSDGQLTLPAANLDLSKEEQAKLLPTGHAIALGKGPDGYLPVAVYSSAQNELVPLNQFASLGTVAEVALATAKEQTKGKTEAEKYYVLEDDYQQLVFSDRGGALVEINLPFETKQDEESVVRPIEIDREMTEQHPKNAFFPAHSYYSPALEGQTGFKEHPKGQLGGYYPLLRRDLINDSGATITKINPHYYATNLVSEYPELAELQYEVKEFTSKSITFEAVQNHRKITKTYRLPDEDTGAPYIIDLEIAIDGDSRGLWLTSGIPDVELISGAVAPALKYRVTRRGQSEVEPIDLPKDTINVSSFHPNWVANSNGFFGLILDPLTDIESGFKAIRVSSKTAPSRLIALDSSADRFKAAELPGYELLLPLKNQPGITKIRLFAGPFAESVLKTVDATYSDPTTGYNPDYLACQSFHGWFAFISEPFARFLFVLMKFFYHLTGSWGFSIILLTAALRLMLYPLNAWSTKSMVAMQAIGPEVAAIQEKYKKDPKKAQLAIMTLYRERGVNPLSGCFPLLIQLPFLIGMFDLLKSTFELRGASFIPGWIDNLTSPDVLFSWNTPIFFIGNQFHLLPILLGLVMFMQQRLMATGPTDANLMTDQQRQQRAMGNVMTVVFAVMFYHFPSGLNIYWLSSMLLGMLQQWWTAKNYKAKQPTNSKTIEVKGKKVKSDN